MLPSVIGSIHRQYRADLDTIANWLATTAKSHGYADQSQTNGSSGQNDGKRKGKGKGGRKPANPSSSQQPPMTFGAELDDPAKKPKHVLKLKDFIPMAKYIAAKGIVVPGTVSIAIEQATRVRLRFWKMYPHIKGAPRDELQEYLYHVLWTVAMQLRPLIEANSDEIQHLKESSTASNRPHQPFKNIFKYLRIEEPTDEFYNTPDLVIPRTAKLEYEAQKEQSMAGIIFAMSTLFDDYERLREEIKGLWARWRSGELDLAAVSVATNAAIELARELEDDINPLLKQHGRHADEIDSAYFSAMCGFIGIEPTHRLRKGHSFNVKAYRLARYCLIPTIGVLNSYKRNYQGTQVISTYSGEVGWFDESRPGMTKSNIKNYDQDMAAIMEILPDIDFLHSRGGIEDELIRGIAQWVDTATPSMNCPLWLAWALQIYLDILRDSGADCEKGYADLRRFTAQVQGSMLQVPDDDQQRSKVLATATRWDVDPLKKLREFLYEHDPGGMGAELPPPPSFKFLKRHPMYCGLTIHNIRSTLHQAGVRYAGLPGGVLAVTQLYQALKQEKLLGDVVWEDLDEFWKLQGNSAFFVGDPPTDREGYYKNYYLSVGGSASNWAPTKRKGKASAQTTNKRNVKHKGWTSLRMNQRLAPTFSSQRAPLSSELIASILEEGQEHIYIEGQGYRRQDLTPEATAEALGAAAEQTPGMLIRRLAEDIQAEVPELEFNYFILHNTAWSFLGELKKVFAELVGDQLLERIPHEDKLPYVVGLAFSTAAGHNIEDTKEKAEASDDLLQAAAKTMREFLEQGSGRAVRDMAEKEFDPLVVKGHLNFEGDSWNVRRLMRELEWLGAPVEKLHMS